MAGAFEALGDPVRRQLLELLADGEQPVGALVDALGVRRAISQPAVSQHLKVLRDASLVTMRAEGTRRLYALDPEGLDRAAAWLTELTRPGAGIDRALDALATEVARGRRTQQQPAGGAGANPAGRPRRRPA